MLIRSDDPADLRQAHRYLSDDWARTVERLRAMPEDSEHEVLAARDQQSTELERWLASVTVDELSAPAPVPAGQGWPPYATGKSVVECLRVVLNEEREHHGFCVRDLDVLSADGDQRKTD